MKSNCLSLFCVIFVIGGCSGIMPPKYVPPSDGPTATVTFTGPNKDALDKSIDYSKLTAEYDFFKCKTISMDNFYGYLYASYKDQVTTKVTTSKPLLIRSSIIGLDFTNKRYEFFSFIPEQDESYYVGFTAEVIQSSTKKGLYLPGTALYFVSYYVDKINRTTGKHERIPVQFSEGNTSLRQTVADWPDC